MTLEMYSKVCAEIEALERKRSRLYKMRYLDITEGAVGPSESFSRTLEKIEVELYALWEEKRITLSLLPIPEELSWLMPVLPA